MKITDFNYDKFRHPHDNRAVIRALLVCVAIFLGVIVIDLTFGRDGWADWTGKVVFVIVILRYVVKSNDARDHGSEREAIFEKYKKSYDEKAPQKTIDQLDTAIVLDPNAPWPYAMRGLIFASQKKEHEAEQDFNKLISLCPFQRFAYWLRGKFYEEHKQYKLALKDYRKARSLGAYWLLSHFYHERKPHEQSPEDYRSAQAFDDERGSINDACQRMAEALKSETIGGTTTSGEAPGAAARAIKRKES